MTNSIVKETNIDALTSIVADTLTEYLHYLKGKKFALKLYKGQDLSKEMDQISHLLAIAKDNRSLDDVLCDLVMDRINFLAERNIGRHEIAAHLIYLNDLGYIVENLDLTDED